MKIIRKKYASSMLEIRIKKTRFIISKYLLQIYKIKKDSIKHQIPNCVSQFEDTLLVI